jgi:hypothetical protein
VNPDIRQAYVIAGMALTLAITALALAALRTVQNDELTEDNRRLMIIASATAAALTEQRKTPDNSAASCGPISAASCGPITVGGFPHSAES